MHNFRGGGNVLPLTRGRIRLEVSDRPRSIPHKVVLVLCDKSARDEFVAEMHQTNCGPLTLLNLRITKTPCESCERTVCCAGVTLPHRSELESVRLAQGFTDANTLKTTFCRLNISLSLAPSSSSHLISKAVTRGHRCRCTQDFKAEQQQQRLLRPLLSLTPPPPSAEERNVQSSSVRSTMSAAESTCEASGDLLVQSVTSTGGHTVLLSCPVPAPPPFKRASAALLELSASSPSQA
eukprot:764311-Hanusia_phi.AAC.4